MDLWVEMIVWTGMMSGNEYFLNFLIKNRNTLKIDRQIPEKPDRGGTAYKDGKGQNSAAAA
jgi:hypothetical protein